MLGLVPSSHRAHQQRPLPALQRCFQHPRECLSVLKPGQGALVVRQTQGTDLRVRITRAKEGGTQGISQGGAKYVKLQRWPAIPLSPASHPWGPFIGPRGEHHVIEIIHLYCKNSNNMLIYFIWLQK